jgi:tetratricopeptide (TPR) repeat protein
MNKLVRKLSTLIITTSAALIIFPQNSSATMSSSQIDQIARKVTVKIEDDNRSNGSGVIVAKLGSTYFVLTAEHVVKTEQGYTISTHNGKTYPAKYSSMVKLPNVDLAVVPFSSQENYAIAKLGDSNKVRRGTKTFIAGFPAVTRKYRFTNGDVVANASSKAVELGYTLIYSNPTDRGMSGGGVFNENGEIVGIHGKADDTGSEKGERVLTGYKAGIPVNTFLTILPNTKLALGFGVPTSSDNGATAIDDLIAKAIELARREKYRELLAVTEKAIKDGVANDVIYVANGFALSNLGDKKGALLAYNQALRINPNSFLAYSSRGNVRYTSGDKQGAIEDYNQAIKIVPNYAITYHNRGTARADLGDNQGAIEDFNQAIKIEPNFLNPYVNRGNVRSSLGDKKGAIEDFNQVLKISPNFATAYYNRGAARSDLGDTQGAMEDFNQAIKINPNAAAAYYFRGNTRSNLGDKKGAIEDFNQAIKINPNFASAYVFRGIVRSDLGERRRAIEDFNQAIKIDPNFALAYYNRGFERSDLGDKKGAMEDYNQAIKISPNYAPAYNNRGVTRSDLGDKQGAINDLSKAAELFDKQGDQSGKNRVLRSLRRLQN